MQPPAIELRGVSKTYREGAEQRSVLRDVEARIAPGEFVVLLGKSGSGKSTLLNLISGIDVPTRGAVEVMGASLGQMSEEQRTLFRRTQVGFIFQAFNLIPTLTVHENLMLPMELGGRVSSADRQHARDLLAEVGLGTRGASFPDTLSGGEQQRVAVARALVHRPSLVLADEPTGNLDDNTGRDILDLIDRLTRLRHGTILIASHDRELVARADRVLVLERGELCERAKDAEAR
jgi:putative ABC transport system ATP-binding protein